MQPGRRRHAVTLQSPVETQNEIGEPIVTWQDFATGVRAAIESVNGREFFAADQVQSDVTSKINIRARSGVNSQMRVVHTFTTTANVSPPETQTDVYDIEAVLPDRTGRREIVLMCRLRAAEGFRTDGVGGGTIEAEEMFEILLESGDVLTTETGDPLALEQ